MNCEEIQKYLEDGWELIDVRTVMEYNKLSVVNSKLVPLQKIIELPKGKYLLYCLTGHRAALAERKLKSWGSEAINIGGIVNFSDCLQQNVESK